MEALGDALVGRYGGRLLINIPKPIVDRLGLKPTTFRVVSVGGDRAVLAEGPGPVKVLVVGRKLRMYAPANTLPFEEGDRVLVKAVGKSLIIEKIDYYVVKPSVKEGNYFRVNIPWELVTKLGLDKCELVKVRERGGKVIIEPLK